VIVEMMMFVVMIMVIVVATMRVGERSLSMKIKNNETTATNNNNDNIIRLQKVRTNGDHSAQQIRCISMTFIPTTHGLSYVRN
jgi:hypothetical protein